MSAAVAIAAILVGSIRLGAQDCKGLVGRAFQDALVTETDSVTNPFTIASLDSKRGVTVTSPFCRVRGVITPSPDSNINFEVWLPPQEAWNGRYEGIGNGGFAGSMIYPALNQALQAGYAASGTDTGHSGTPPESRWALYHPEKIEDLGWRSIHDAAVASKAIIAAYYGKDAAHSYFNGCSTGGRQGLVEAQRFPTDYNGIVVGAPANWPYLLASDLATTQVVAEKPENWVSPAKMRTVAQAALVACRAESGVIDDPSQCSFDPARLECKDATNDSCLTAPELATLRTIYGGLRDGTGKVIYPGFPPGTESGWSTAKMGPGPGRVSESSTFPYPTGYFSNFVFSDPQWDFRTIGPVEALKRALDTRAGKAVDVANPDLSAFRAAGGKLIQYHGWADPAIPAASSINYFESVAARMGDSNNVQSFYRLFLAPGMSHCVGGPGPSAIGGAFSQPPPVRDAEHDVVTAVANWVEKGAPPSKIMATSYHDNDPGKGIAAERLWCVYPASARYSGQGDRLLAANWVCSGH